MTAGTSPSPCTCGEGNATWHYSNCRRYTDQLLKPKPKERRPMTDQPAPLTDEQYTAIRQRHTAASSGSWPADRDFVYTAHDDMGSLLAEVDRLRSEHDELLTELDGRDEKARKRWIRKQEKQLGIRFADFREGRWEMDLAMAREMAAAYVAMAKTMLSDGPNYSETKLEFDVKIAESPEVYTLVVQRHAPGALTPHEARQRAEAERDKALADVEQLRAENERMRAIQSVHTTGFEAVLSIPDRNVDAATSSSALHEAIGYNAALSDVRDAIVPATVSAPTT